MCDAQGAQVGHPRTLRAPFQVPVHALVCNARRPISTPLRNTVDASVSCSPTAAHQQRLAHPNPNPRKRRGVLSRGLGDGRTALARNPAVPYEKVPARNAPVTAWRSDFASLLICADTRDHVRRAWCLGERICCAREPRREGATLRTLQTHSGSEAPGFPVAVGTWPIDGAG